MYVDRVHALCEVISHEGPTSSPVSLSREPGNEVDEGLLSQVFFLAWYPFLSLFMFQLPRVLLGGAVQGTNAYKAACAVHVSKTSWYFRNWV